MEERIRQLKKDLSKYMYQLTTEGNPVVAEAYKSYLVDQLKRPPDEVIAEAIDQLLFLVDSVNVYNDLHQYLNSKNSRDYAVESICRLIKELTGEELLSLESFNDASNVTNALFVQLGKYGLSKNWLISHGLASEQEMLRLQQSHNITGISYKKMKSGMRIDSVELSGSIIIPEFIEGEPVVKIASGAFANRKDITSVILPQYLLEIDEKAFSESGIISITIPDSVQLIGEKAFFNCRQLERITLSNGMKNIKRETFAGCAALTAIKIPDGIKTIGELVFDRCRRLKKYRSPILLRRLVMVLFPIKQQCIAMKSQVHGCLLDIIVIYH